MNLNRIDLARMLVLKSKGVYEDPCQFKAGFGPSHPWLILPLNLGQCLD